MELKINNLVKQFGGIHALKGVSLSFSGNELVGLIGPNGSGKTTMINTICGIYVPTKGNILFNGRWIIYVMIMPAACPVVSKNCWNWGR
jgi:branched-chain amino acid transport system ATP-binding protein